MQLTTKKVAEILNVKQVTVRAWCDKGLFKDAIKESSPCGDFWLIPENNINNFKLPRKGRKSYLNPSNSTLLKRAQRKMENE